MRGAGQLGIQRNVGHTVGGQWRRATIVETALGVIVPTRIEIDDAVVQRAISSTGAGITSECAVVQRAGFRSTAIVAGQRAVIQRAAIRASTDRIKTIPVAGYDAVGNHRIGGFTRHSATRYPGSSIGQGETREAGPADQVHAPTGLAGVDSSELGAINAPQADWFVHSHPVGRDAVLRPSTSSVNAVGHHDLVAGCGFVHRLLDGHGSGRPIRVGRPGTGAVNIDIAHGRQSAPGHDEEHGGGVNPGRQGLRMIQVVHKGCFG